MVWPRVGRGLSPGRTSMLGLVRANPVFRRLWLGQVVSQLGDWFNSIALYTLLLEHSGKGSAVGGAILGQLLPIFLLGPIAGVVADRLPRKRILIWTDLLRALVVLGFLIADHPDRWRLAYPLLWIQVGLSAFFLPARQAMLPHVVAKHEINAANALSGITWSVLLAIGAGIGGLVTASFGRSTAFVIDSISYLVSALILLPTPEFRPPASAPRQGLAAALGLEGMGEGAHYLRREPGLLSVVLVKSMWGLAGGVLLLHTVFGQRVFPIGHQGAIAIGCFYAIRGVGAAVGPIAARRGLGETPAALLRSISLGFVAGAVGCLGLGFAPTLPVALAAVFVGHLGGSILWVASSTLLHHRASSAFSGRVFAAEQAGVTLAMSISTWCTGQALDLFHISPAGVARTLGCYLLLPALLWLGLQRLGRRWYSGWNEEETDPAPPVGG